MNEDGAGGTAQERRSARRFEARHVARLQFVTPLTGLRGVEGAALWPTLICRTRDVSASGLSLLVPALREDDENFFGVEGPVRVTLGLPTGAVEAGAVAVRYERGGGGPEEFLICLEITEMEDAAAERWASQLRSYVSGV